MENPIDIQTKRTKSISQKYRRLIRDIPENYDIHFVHYNKDDIDQYPVIYWHRLLRKIYGKPQEVECELLKKNVIRPVQSHTAIFRETDEDSNWIVHRITEENLLKLHKGEIHPRPINWKYFIQLPTGGILELGSKDRSTDIYFALVIEEGGISENDEKEAKRFISVLLEKANILKQQLFNPKKELDRYDNPKLYNISNVYLSNYITAEEMLKLADTQEPQLRKELLKYDARTNDIYDDEKNRHIDQFTLLCGMYYNSAIAYFFMALEGFINIVLHAFLKQNLRDKDLNIEERFDLELKIKLMPLLCSCFSDRQDYLTSELYDKFKKLKKYRNSIFHSKVEHNLINLNFVEDGFFYNYDMEKSKKDLFLPLNRFKLAKDDVIKVKTIIDELVSVIMIFMTENARTLSKKYILEETRIPFWTSDNGQLSLGIIPRKT